MRLVFMLAAFAVSLFTVKLYASSKPLLEEEFKSSRNINIQTFLVQANEEIFQTSKVAAFSKWDIVQENLWKNLIEWSKQNMVNQPGSRPVDLIGVIDFHINWTGNQSIFAESIKNMMGLYETDYIEYLWARCNQVKRAAAEKGGINAMKKENLEGYKQLIRDILRQPIEFIEPRPQEVR